MSGARSVIGSFRHARPPVVDALIAAAVFGASLVNIAVQAEAPISEIPAAGFLLLAVASIALLWRRSRALAVLGVALAMALAWVALGYKGNPVFHILVSLYAVGRHVPDGRFSVGALAAALGVNLLGQLTDGDPISDVVTGVVVTVLPWYVGRRVRVRWAAARERAEHLEWKRATDAQRAIDDARAAIARELHDVVAHNVSVMTVQAGLARLVVADDPAKAEEAIGEVEEAGRRALDELRHLLGVLRPETASDELGPQPGLTQVLQLVDRLQQTGMRVSLAMDAPPDLPVRVELFAYRIVQEALTNVLKHGGGDAAAQVRIQTDSDHLDIEVTDTGTGAGTGMLPGSGHGIIGMNERAALLGGTFEAGPQPEGGFRVRARLPMGDP